MSDVRKSVPAKVIASLLILVSVFSLCWQGMAVLRGIDYVLTDSWQDTWEFKELIREREDQAGRVVRGQSCAGGSWTGLSGPGAV